MATVPKRSHGASASVSQQRSLQWRWDALLVLASVALPLLIYPDVLAGLFQRWLKFDQAYSHGFVVAALSIWLGGRVLRGHRFAVRPAITGAVLTLLTSFGIAMAGIVSVQIVEQMGLVFLVWTLILASLGWRAGGYFLFPVGFLGFAVPFWDYFAYPLQKVTTAVSGLFLGIWDIRFRIEDYTFIHLEDIGVVEVANGCSGQRYLVIALTLAALFSYLNLRRASSWALFLSAAALLALITNWVRVFVLVLVGYESVMTSSLLEEHEFYGWILFIVMLVPLGWLGDRLIRREGRADGGRRDDASPAAARASAAPGKRALGLALALLALLLPLGFLSAMQTSGATGMAAPALPSALAGYKRTESSSRPLWQPVWAEADSVALAGYGRESAATGSEAPALWLGLWHYRRQRSGSELIQYTNVLVPPDRWQVIQARSVKEGPLSGRARLLVLERRFSSERVAVAYTYFVAGEWTAEEVMAKLYQGWAALSGNAGAALIAVSTSCSKRCEDSAGKLATALGDARALYTNGE